MTTIVIDGLTKKYGKKTVFNDFSLTIPSNRLTCIMGPNGSGKTTLLKIIAGIEPFQRGQVQIGDSSSFNTNQPSHSSTKKLAFVFQEPRLLPWKTILQNVTYGLKTRGIPKQEREKLGLDILREFGLASMAQAFPHQLSGGMQQKVNLARALITEPDVLLLDEPFNNLDIVIIEEVVSLLQELHESKRMTILMVNHYLELSSKLCDQIVFLDGSNLGSPLVISKMNEQYFDQEVKNAFHQLQIQHLPRRITSLLASVEESCSREPITAGLMNNN